MPLGNHNDGWDERKPWEDYNKNEMPDGEYDLRITSLEVKENTEGKGNWMTMFAIKGVVQGEFWRGAEAEATIFFSDKSHNVAQAKLKAFCVAAGLTGMKPGDFDDVDTRKAIVKEGLIITAKKVTRMYQGNEQKDWQFLHIADPNWDTTPPPKDATEEVIDLNEEKPF
jgi:hypothetical protein